MEVIIGQTHDFGGLACPSQSVIHGTETFVREIVYVASVEVAEQFVPGGVVISCQETFALDQDMLAALQLLA